MPAILPIGSMGGNAMSKEELRNEKLCQATMHIARKMMSEGLISEEEYRKVEVIFLKKYHPVLGSLFSTVG